MTIENIFLTEDLNATQNLLKEYLADLKDNAITEEKINKIYNSEYFKFLPALFTFNFPEESIYNKSEYIKNGLESLMDNEFTSFNVMFYDKNGSDPDEYASTILRELLPVWTIFVNEYHVRVEDGPELLTVKEFYDFLISLGFEYHNYKDSNCIFKEFIEV